MVMDSRNVLQCIIKDYCTISGYCVWSRVISILLKLFPLLVSLHHLLLTLSLQISRKTTNKFLSDNINFNKQINLQTNKLSYELIYQLDAIEYLFVYFQLDTFRAYTPIFRSDGCYNFFTYAAYGVLDVVRCRS